MVLKRKLNAGIKFIKAFQKMLHFFLTKRPYKENIIHVSSVYTCPLTYTHTHPNYST